MNKSLTKIPVIFQKLSSYDTSDTRFVAVKIWLLHTGENYNGSYFSKEVVDKAIPSLANTPILAYIEDNANGDEDFSDHRVALAKKNGEWGFKYMGSAYGIIPETNNAQWEKRVGDDGIEREYLTVEGLVWTKFSDAVDILNRDLVKSQSMELAEDYEGQFDDKDGLFHFSKFKFFGACMLGMGVSPAMNSASIEMFSKEDVFQEIQKKMEEFKLLTNSNHSSKGGNDVNEKLELLQSFSLTQEEVEAKGVNFEEISLEDLKAELEKFQSEADATLEDDGQEDATGNEEDAEDSTDSNGDSDCSEEEGEANNDADTNFSTGDEGDINKQPSTSFALSAKQLKDELSLKLSARKKTDDWGYTYCEFWYVDHLPDTQTVIAYDSDDYFLVGMNYTVTGDAVEINFDSVQRMKIEYAPMDVQYQEGDNTPIMMSVQHHEFKVQEQVNKLVSAKATEFESKFSAMESELTELRSFKAEQEKIARENQENEVFENFSDKLTQDEIDSVRKVASNFSIEALEEKLFALVGKKTTSFSTNKREKNVVKVGLDLGDTHVSSKPYAHLIEKVRK